MSFRYQRRINLGKGSHLNISKSGASFSKRTKFGSVGSRGFSIKTGIPGLSFRKRWGKSSGGLVFFLVFGALLLSVIVIYNLLRLLVFGVAFLIEKIRGKG
ncbi:DUF4236 domain-containing protein [Fulvivirga kasyanovii]|uniref:DUF4236 domain-containing protein n=1 Tax=Fulvivirga kasyanovii TaxID=396812 RepID=A0ABW9RLK1_9BACT|nr:DUF4236 domain-containing protein [Fulvivirga kasyanovii]MTI24997.1 DUF4236 domain-containing protein [Fulvivirga kasyanovii]